MKCVTHEVNDCRQCALDAQILREALDKSSSMADYNSQEGTPVDFKIGFGVFKKGASFENIKKEVDRHNLIYRELLRITPTAVTNKIVKRLKANG